MGQGLQSSVLLVAFECCVTGANVHVIHTGSLTAEPCFTYTLNPPTFSTHGILLHLFTMSSIQRLAETGSVSKHTQMLLMAYIQRISALTRLTADKYLDNMLRFWFVHSPNSISNFCVEILARDSMLTCVADIAAITKYKPHSATTNFSFILAAIKKPEHQQLLDTAIEYGKSKGGKLSEQIDAALDRLHVEFGRVILDIVPGTVSTAMEAKYAFDTVGNVNKASQLLDVSHDLRIFRLFLRF